MYFMHAIFIYILFSSPWASQFSEHPRVAFSPVVLIAAQYSTARTYHGFSLCSSNAEHRVYSNSYKPEQH